MTQSRRVQSEPVKIYLNASLLPTLPSDKHVPGTEPRGDGKTTDAIQSTPTLLCEPGVDTSKKTSAPRENEPKPSVT